MPPRHKLSGSPDRQLHELYTPLVLRTSDRHGFFLARSSQLNFLNFRTVLRIFPLNVFVWQAKVSEL